MSGQGTGYIFRALGANLTIAVAKGIGAFITGSGALLAETLHSLSDCVNQVLLLVGLKQSARPPDARYPLGQGRNLYFWSFMVAMLLFLGGGAYAIYEGVHKLRHPEPLDKPLIAVGILVFSLAIEGWALAGAYKAVAARKGNRSLIKYLRETKDSDLVVIFGEDGAAVLGLALALIAVLIAMATGNPAWDALGSLAIGAVLIGVAFFLAVEVKSLLLGESADPALLEIIEACAKEDPRILKVLRTLTVQQGPGEIVVACKLQFRADLTTQTLVDSINQFEVRLHEKVPEVRWSFIEPDDVE
ncbi:MAG: cation diffusion facilitator family transporter [Kofleriaceae bacterium]